MPELPEVEIIKRSLFKMVNKAKINNVKIYNKNLRYTITKNFRKSLLNEKIIKISRKSKYIIFHFKKKILLAHLGMTGKMLLIKRKSNKIFKTSFYYDLNILAKHNHIFFILNNGFNLVYNDIRRFKLYEHKDLKKINYINKLGPEPFSKFFKLKYFKNFILNKKKNIKNLLMDQTFVSGLGNIYVNEALFMSRVNPFRECNSLKNKEIKRLITNIKLVLKNSISKGGSSIKDFKNVSGKNGSYQQFFKVYSKENKKCSRISCSGKIKKMFISNRSSFYCNECQK